MGCGVIKQCLPRGMKPLLKENKTKEILTLYLLSTVRLLQSDFHD